MENPAAPASPVASTPVAPERASDASQPHADHPPRVSVAIEPAPPVAPTVPGSPAGAGLVSGASTATQPDMLPASAAPSSPPSSALPVPPATALDDVDISGDEPMNAPPGTAIDAAHVADAAIAALAPTATSAAGAPTAADLDDVQMESPPDAFVVPAPAPVDTRPTMAQLLQQQETIRRDEADVEERRSRIETPKPLACDIESIERQYAAGRGWSFIAPRMEQARPYEMPRARFDMVIDTGRTFAKTPLPKILASLAGSSHGNAVLENLYAEHEIGQISKLPGGNLRVKIKSQEACLKLERTRVNILGGVFMFKEYDVLAGKYFLDISNVDSDTSTDTILHRLYILGCKPIYDTFREVNMATGITSATWRVYFLSRTCPPPLMVNGSVCDQILFDNKLHPAHGKNAPYQSERLPYGYRSLHGIDLLTSDEIFPRPAEQQTAPAVPPTTTQPPPKTQQPPPKTQQPPPKTQQPPPKTQQPPSKTQQSSSTPPQLAAKQPQAPSKTFALALKIGKPMTSLQKAVYEDKKRAAKLQQGAQHGSQPGANQLAIIPSPQDDALSISTFNDSAGKMSPPGSPKSTTKTPIMLLTNGGNDDGFSTVNKKKKRSRGSVDFTVLLREQQLEPLDGIATDNYFDVLQSMEVELEVVDVTVDKTHGVRKQLVPKNVKRPDKVKTAVESAYFVEKHHTKIVRSAEPTQVIEVTESMINDENMAVLDTLPDKLEAADAKVASMTKLIENASNPDHIMKAAVASPLAFNSALSLAMAGNGSVVNELAQLHVINRVLSATNPFEDLTFAAKWKRVMKTPLPSKRSDLFKACAMWWTHSDAITELSRASKALGMFELALMSTAPLLFKNDHWIQYFTGRPVEWIPAHHTRFLHPNTLIFLLRSEIGALCMAQWREVQWQGHLLDDLEALRKLDGYYALESSVMQVRSTDDGVVTTVAGSLSSRN